MMMVSKKNQKRRICRAERSDASCIPKWIERTFASFRVPEQTFVCECIIMIANIDTSRYHMIPCAAQEI